MAAPTYTPESTKYKPTVSSIYGYDEANNVFVPLKVDANGLLQVAEGGGSGGLAGLAVDPETYDPDYQGGDPVVAFAFDKDSGSLLVNQRLLTPADQVSVADSVLPTGAAVEAKQDITIDELSAMNAAVGVVTSGPTTNPTSAGNVISVLKGILSKVLPNGGGNLSIETDDTDGEVFTVLPGQTTNQVTIFNSQEAVVIEVQQDGAGPAVPVFPMTAFTFFGITNTNQLGVRRSDLTAEPVVVTARWEG